MARGQVDLPIVMIFAVVAGVLVLLVVGWFIIKHQSTADNERLLTSLKDIDVAIGTASSTRGVDQNITTLEELRYVCDNTGPSLWYSDTATRAVTSGAFFGSPSTFGLATLRSAPIGEAYRVTNVVYMLSPRDTITAPDDAHLPIPSKSGLYTQMINGVSKTFDVSAGSEPNTGTIKFPDGKTAVYFSPALLAGALVTGDKEAYDCTLTEVLKRYRFINKMQWERVQAIQGRYALLGGSLGDPCQDRYDDQSAFSMIEEALTKNDKTISGADFDDEPQRAEKIAQAERLLMQQNHDLVVASCATMS